MEGSVGLYDYPLWGPPLRSGNACYYSPVLARFISADIIVPDPANPQALNRYAYVGNNPVNYTDPDGHCWPVCTVIAGAAIGAALGAGMQVLKNAAEGKPLDTDIGKAALVGGVSGAVGGATFGLGMAVLGTGLAGTVASGAISGAVAGQAARATENILDGQNVTAGLGNPADMALDAALGGAFAGAGYGTYRAIQSRVI
ncbi:MAG: RHS repeat-associated core domain-containing protein [Candidatus Brachytrichaceae bacterium NZ_4S206]